jgi:hypothetical protein
MMRLFAVLVIAALFYFTINCLNINFCLQPKSTKEKLNVRGLVDLCPPFFSSLNYFDWIQMDLTHEKAGSGYGSDFYKNRIQQILTLRS